MLSAPLEALKFKSALNEIDAMGVLMILECLPMEKTSIFAMVTVFCFIFECCCVNMVVPNLIYKQKPPKKIQMRTQRKNKMLPLWRLSDSN